MQGQINSGEIVIVDKQDSGLKKGPTKTKIDIQKELQRLTETSNPNKSRNIAQLEQNLAQQALQLDHTDPEIKKWILWFLDKAEKHLQGQLIDMSYRGMLQNFQDFLREQQSSS